MKKMVVDNKSLAADGGVVYTFGNSRLSDDIQGEFWIRDDAILDMSCGDQHSAIITVNGSLLTFGCNEWSQLGFGSTNTISKPTIVKTLKFEKCVSVACGRAHTLVATDSGKIYAFGCNTDGQLGIGDTISHKEVVQVFSLPVVQYKLLSAGAEHSAALTETGNLFIWGGGAAGQLGLGDGVHEALKPVEVDLSSAIIHVSCGYYHTALITADGKLYTFGEKDDGKLGLKSAQLQKSSSPQVVQGLSEKVLKVSCGGNHTAVISVTGKVYVFGDGTNGQLGLGTKQLQADRAEIVNLKTDLKCHYLCCGENYTALLTEDGSLYTCGDGRYGKLGFGKENFSSLFQFTQVDRFNDFYVKQVSCGGCHMLVLAVKRMGENYGNNVINLTKENMTLPKDTKSSARLRRRSKKKLLDPLKVNSLPPLASAPAINVMNEELNCLPDIAGLGSNIDDEDVIETEQTHKMKLALNISEIVRHADSDIESDNATDLSPFNKSDAAYQNDRSTLKPCLKDCVESSENEYEESDHIDEEKNCDDAKKSDVQNGSEANDESPSKSISIDDDTNRAEDYSEAKEKEQNTDIQPTHDKNSELQSTSEQNNEDQSSQKKSKVGNFFNNLRRSFKKKKDDDGNIRKKRDIDDPQFLAEPESTDLKISEEVNDKAKNKSKFTHEKKSKACSIL